MLSKPSEPQKVFTSADTVQAHVLRQLNWLQAAHRKRSQSTPLPLSVRSKVSRTATPLHHSNAILRPHHTHTYIPNYTLPIIPYTCPAPFVLNKYVKFSSMPIFPVAPYLKSIPDANTTQALEALSQKRLVLRTL